MYSDFGGVGGNRRDIADISLTFPSDMLFDDWGRVLVDMVGDKVSMLQ